MQFDKTKTLEELDGDDWGEPNFPSYVVRESHRLRKKRIVDLTNEELRLAVSQQIGLDYLLPVAIERLEEDPMAEGDYYAGDVLAAVLRLPEVIWSASSENAEALKVIISRFFGSRPRDGCRLETGDFSVFARSRPAVSGIAIVEPCSIATSSSRRSMRWRQVAIPSASRAIRRSISLLIFRHAPTRRCRRALRPRAFGGGAPQAARGLTWRAMSFSAAAETVLRS